MKKFYIILIALLIVSGAKAQSCLPEGIIFETQAQIDNFQTNYPNCTEIEGDVDINTGIPSYDITSLNGLIVLTSIGGNLHIYANEALNNLTGLDNVTYIGGDLDIFAHANLISLTGLEGLTSIGGELIIYYNNALTSMTGLDNVNSIGGLYITYCEALTSLTGLENMTSIGGNLHIYGNEAMTSLTGLEGLASIGGDLLIEHSDALTSLTGLDNLTSIGGYFEIDADPVLTSLTGLAGLVSIGGDFGILSNVTLTGLIGLESLTSIGGNLTIHSNDLLTSLTGLEGLTSIGGDLDIVSNEALTSLTGLDNINADSISNLIIAGNDILSTCDVQCICDYLSAPNGTVIIIFNAAGCNSIIELANACGETLLCLPYGNYYLSSQADIDNFQTVFPNCTELNGDVTIAGDNITNLNGIGVWTSIEGELSIRDNFTLTSLTGLDSVTSIGGDLIIISNSALTSLTGLDNLTAFGGDLIIISNSALTSLTGIDNIDAGSISDLNIASNQSLSTCEVQSICDYLASPNGVISINDNSAGCNSQQEVEMACGSCLPEGIIFTTQAQIDSFQVIYPGCTEIEGHVNIGAEMGTINITNLNGLIVLNSIGDYLHFERCFSLPNLTGLDNLTSIGSHFSIFSSGLTSLTGLDNLNSIGGDLDISYNSALTSLTGLDNITAGSITNLDISNNITLSDCAVQSICDYLAAPNGTVEIHDNATGCDNPVEVLAACGVGLDENGTSENQFNIFPNPSTTTITITTPTTPQKNTTLTIYNISGQQLLTRQITEKQTVVDVSGLPLGVYFVKVTDDRAVMVQKFIKQ